MLATPLLTTALYVLLYSTRRLLLTYPLQIAAIFYVLRTVSLYFDENPEFYDDVRLGSWSLYSPNNETLAIFLLVAIWAFKKEEVMFRHILLLAIVLVFSTSLGTFIGSLAMFGMLFIKNGHRAICIGVFIGSLVFSLISPFYFDAIFDLDGNAGVRAIFWRDTQVALLQSYGIGVGYGTEWITNWFGDVGRLEWNLTPEWADDRLFIPNHNFLYDIALRLGVPGLIFALTWFWTLARQPQSGAMGPMTVFFVVSASVTPAMTAVDTQIGISMLLAWLLVEIRMVEDRAPSSSAAPNPFSSPSGYRIGHGRLVEM